jgi:hypothetical protein
MSVKLTIDEKLKISALNHGFRICTRDEADKVTEVGKCVIQELLEKAKEAGIDVSKFEKKKNTMILDERTFGDSPAAIDMVRIINKRGLDSRKPRRLLNRFDKITSDINHVGITSAIHLMHLLYKESCEKCESFEEPLNSYTKNVLATKFKLWQLRKGALTPKKNRKS